MWLGKPNEGRTFCEAIIITCQAARLHRAISKGGPESNQALRKEDKKKLELLLATHFPGSTLQTDGNTTLTAQSRPRATDSAKAKSIVTTERLRWAIGTFQPYKSPGPDGIPASTNAKSARSTDQENTDQQPSFTTHTYCLEYSKNGLHSKSWKERSLIRSRSDPSAWHRFCLKRWKS